MSIDWGFGGVRKGLGGVLDGLWFVGREGIGIRGRGTFRLGLGGGG